MVTPTFTGSIFHMYGIKHRTLIYAFLPVKPIKYNSSIFAAVYYGEDKLY